MIANPAVVWLLSTFVATGPVLPQDMVPYKGVPHAEFATRAACVKQADAMMQKVKWPVVFGCWPADRL